MAEIRTTLYSRELQKQIFPDNSFYKKSIAETGVADDVITVEKPIQNKISEAKEGAPDSLPLKIETSTDTKKTYDTTLLYCQPLLIDSQSELLTNYSKRQTKQEQQAAELNNKAADYCAYHWFPTKPANRLLYGNGSYNTLRSAQLAKKKVKVKYGYKKEETGDTFEEGMFVISSLERNDPADEDSSYSATLDSSGDVEIKPATAVV